MNKRSAMTVAAGLVLALVVAGIAVAMGVTGPDSSRTSVAAPGNEREPIVKTTTETIKVHKTAEPGAAPVVVRTSSPETETGDDGSVEGFQDDEASDDDDAFEDEEHDEDEGEDEDQEDTEDHEGLEDPEDEEHADDDD